MQQHKRRSFKTSGQSEGFLLLQLALTLCILTVFATLTISTSSFLHRWHVRTQLEQLYALLYFTQQRAMTLHKDLSITFDPALNLCKSDTQTIKLNRYTTFGFIPTVKGPPSDPKTALTSAITFPNNSITFHADGTIQAGSIYLTDNNKKNLYAVTVPIGEVSYIRKYRFDRHWIPL